MALALIANKAMQPGPIAGRSPDRLAAFAMAVAFVAGSATAQTQAPPRGADTAPPSIRPLLGAWDIELADSSRKCTITLGSEAAAQGRQLRFPATCRRALPVLNEARAWTTGAGPGPSLTDAAGKALIVFGSASDGGFEGKGFDGKLYRLSTQGHIRARPQPPSTPAELAATAAQRPTAIDPSLAPPPESLPGRYVMLRQKNREACRLTLNAGPLNSAGRAPAAFDGACQDTGLVIFDPAGWRYLAGRLTLVARKGHSIDLVFENGEWRKDPAVGAPLLLRKLP